MTHRHTWTLRILSALGVLMLAAGVLCAGAAVLETRAYALFVEGGRFHYPGHRRGGVMFAIITLSLLAYAGLGAILLALGYGHLRHRARSVLLAESFTWTWMVIGLPLLMGAAILTLMAKSLSSGGALLSAGIAFLLAYPVGPLLLLLLYRRARTSGLLQGDISTAPPLSARGPAMVLVSIAALALLPMLMSAPLPWFGRIITGIRGTVPLLATATGLLMCAWAIFRGRAWGWWGAIGILAVLALSATMTSVALSIGEAIFALHLVPDEARWFAYLPFLDIHPIGLSALPFLVLIVVLLAARRAGKGPVRLHHP